MRTPLIACLLLTALLGQTDIDTELPCEDCHAPDGWTLASDRTFNHDQTAFPLDHAHTNADCIQCHSGRSVADRHRFSSVESACSACHLDVHQGQYSTDCTRCHTTLNWELTQNRFDHDRKLFPLTGVHRQLPCDACHGGGVLLTIEMAPTACLGCHADTYTDAVSRGHLENEDCAFCHNSRAWQPVDMSQHDRLFPIYSGEHRGVWTTCSAECHTVSSDYTQFSCGLSGVCHAHDRSRMDEEHEGEVSGYRYESLACYNCHPRGEEVD